ncbi:BREX-1 system adenine-specific DNA-methyltransferase PglX [Collinsella sp. KGMB02528]|uniref:site-specific DNA-methyltransferase (adenine-specific) n=2 Tax=Collinsella acetigenes TaxID=2713419 RepID=A0A7X9UBC8_9ACTN|nr:BREX-1 system adenine-specific DNA-methyltransferase PglX [Collinsella acetigenes]
MDSMNDTAIKNYCTWARTALIKGVAQRMERYNISEGAEAGLAAVGPLVLNPQEAAQRDELLRLCHEEGTEHLRDRAAYTWFNRIAAVRYMEVHDYLPSRVRMFTRPAAAGTWELGSQAVDEALDVQIEGVDPMRVAELKQAGEDEPLFRYLFLAQCDELSGCLAGAFQPVDACMALLLPANLMDADGVIGRMVGDIDEASWDDVQVLGWMYQYYNSKVKDAFFASKAKETPDTIGPAIQLFTPDWIVRYMVQNSLGRLWMLNNPASPLREQMEYYIEPDAEHEDFIRIDGPEDITLCDPACGSGHILVYAFELLARMYLERGYRERDIPELILTKNLAGMEIDPRAAQIASLALAMCARAYDRRFFGRGVQADIAVLAPVALEEGDVPQGSALEKRKDLVGALAHLDEVGSLLAPGEGDLEALREAIVLAGDGGLFGSSSKERLQRALGTCEALACRHDCVVANPPYMGSSSFGPFMSKWVKKNYPDSKSDLCTCFIERGFNLAKDRGYAAMITMQSWMFLGSYEKLREKILRDHSISSMAHLGTRAFGAIGGEVVSTTATVFTNAKNDGDGTYFRLVDMGSEEEKKAGILEALADPDCGWFYRRDADTFKQIPGTPIAYWMSEGLFNAYEKGGRLGDVVDARVGMISGDNNRFLRMWFEPSAEKIGFGGSYLSPCCKKWNPIQKGGEYRLWYGNLDHVINWENDGWELKEDNFDGSRVRSHNYNGEMAFRRGITWNSITSGRFQCRYSDEGFLFDAAGPLCYVNDHAMIPYVLGLMSSSVFVETMGIVNPTLNFPPNYIEDTPFIFESDYQDVVDNAVSVCVKAEKSDWDSLETSWDFKRNPLI